MGEPREQFTFYRSFWEAIEPLSRKDRAAIILAVCEYGLYEAEPKGLSPVAAACFNLIRPVLDSGRRKAASGKQGGKKPKQTGSKPEAKGKQSAREKEGEVEEEGEIEGEGDRSKPQAISFEAFFAAYPKQSCMEEARNAWYDLDPEELPAVMESLERWKASEDWAEEGGKFIPRAVNWLSRGTWRDTPRPKPSADGRRPLSEAELEAIRRMMEEDDP